MPSAVQSELPLELSPVARDSRKDDAVEDAAWFEAALNDLPPLHREGLLRRAGA